MTENQTLCVIVDPASPRFKQIGVLKQMGEVGCFIKFADGKREDIKHLVDVPGSLPKVCFFEARDSRVLFETLLNMLKGSGSSRNLDLLTCVRALAEPTADADILWPSKITAAARETFLDLVGDSRS